MKKILTITAVLALLLAGCKSTDSDKSSGDGYVPWWASSASK